MNQKTFLCYIIITLLWGRELSAQKRIITLSSALSETVYALGKGEQIVAVDVTSEYPMAIKHKPRASRDRTFSLEGLLSFRPDLVLAEANDISYPVESKLRKLGVKVVLFQRDYSLKGADRFVRDVATAVGLPQVGTTLVNELDMKLKSTMGSLKRGNKKPKVLFIYARGAGLMSVAGRGSSIDAIISLAGGQNAVTGFTDFKPYTTESLIKANPDVLLLFDFGTSSLGGKNAVLNMPGVALTNAGRSKNVISMDGPLLINFSTRLPQAIQELNSQLFKSN